VHAHLDAIDWAILKELQDDGRMTNVELARRVGISAPPCLRRLRALEEAGIITGYRALVDARALGFEVTLFAMVGLASQSEAAIAAFARRVAAWPAVREAYMLSGEVDFLLKCVAPDLRSFQALVAELTAAEHVASVRTSLLLREVKNAPAVPVEANGE
jgi:DNA-binding Lrp family transcriptional regulator